MRFFKENNSLCFKHQYETMMITPWGKNALRVRATKYPQFTQHDWALEEVVPDTSKEVSIEINEDNTASIQNGRLSLKIDASGILTYYRDGKKFLISQRLRSAVLSRKPVFKDPWQRVQGNHRWRLYLKGSF